MIAFLLIEFCFSSASDWRRNVHSTHRPCEGSDVEVFERRHPDAPQAQGLCKHNPWHGCC